MADLIVMIGYRGAGKSSLARSLSQKIGWDYISSDAEIEKQVGPLSEWVPRQGWPAFREKEHRVCQDLSRREKTVIDLGGGAVENSENLSCFKDRAIVFWIDTDIDILIQRLQKDSRRPLLSGDKNSLSKKFSRQERNLAIEEETRHKYGERLPLYCKFSDHRIKNDRPLEEVVGDILKIIENHHTINKDR